MLTHGPAERSHNSAQRLYAPEAATAGFGAPQSTVGEDQPWPAGIGETGTQPTLVLANAAESGRAGSNLKNGLKRFASTFTMIMAVGGPVTGGAMYVGDMVRDNLNTCEAVEPRYLAAANALLALPDNQALLETNRTNDLALLHADLVNSALEQKNAQRLFSVQNEVAAQNNLTVRSHWPYAQKLEADLIGISPKTVDMRPETAVPVSEYIDSARSFLGTYNIGLRLATPDDDLAHDFKPPQGADLETTTTKLNLLNIMRYVSSQPAEYLAEGTTNEYIIAAADDSPNPADPASGERVPIYAYKRSLEQSSVVINSKQPMSVAFLAHEDGHGHDFVECGSKEGMEDDPHFEALSGDLEYTGDMTVLNTGVSHERLITQRDEIDRLAHISNQLSTTSRANLAAGRQQLQAEAKDITYESDYAQMSVDEDKATTAQIFTAINSLSYNEIMRLDCPLKQKVTHLMARAIKHSSVGARTMRYFTDLNLRQNAL